MIWAASAGGVALVVLLVAVLIGAQRGTLEIHVNYPGAVVQVLTLKGEVEAKAESGKGPVSIRVGTGRHRVLVQKDGFFTFKQEFVIHSFGKTSLVKPQLAPTGVAGANRPTIFPPNPKPAAGETDELSKKDQGPHWWDPMFPQFQQTSLSQNG